MLENYLAAPTKANINTLLLIYFGAVAVLLLYQWRSKRAVGLPLAYAFGFSMMHATAAFVYGLPQYTPRAEILIQNNVSLLNTLTGFRVACCGFVFFVVGVLVSRFLFSRDPVLKAFQADRRLTAQFPGTLLIISFLAFFAAPILRRIPSMGSMATAGTYVSVIAVFLYCLMAYRRKDMLRLGMGMVSTVGFPIVTIGFLGFAGYGASAATFVWTLVLRFFRPRWLSLIVLGVIVYAGLTFYVNWMRERDQIRTSVWGEQSFGHRFERVMGLIENFEPLSWGKQYHLELIDLRLNQNDLVGKAVLNLQRGRVEYAHGYTMLVAAVAWVPRIIWPGKPATGGSGTVVTHFTGQRFAEGTSVGAGQAMEFFVNFGWLGTCLGFLGMGIAISWFDRRGAFYLEHGDYWSATRWLLPGLGLIQPGGLLAECTGSVAAFAVFATILHHALFKKYYDMGALVQHARAAYAAPVATPAKPLPRQRYLE